MTGFSSATVGFVASRASAQAAREGFRFVSADERPRPCAPCGFAAPDLRFIRGFGCGLERFDTLAERAG